jgi:hypothetical protein
MRSPGKILMFGLFAVAGYAVFAVGRPVDTNNPSRSFVSPASAFCTVEHYFQFHETAQRLDFNAIRAPLGFDACGPGHAVYGQPRADQVADDDELD